MSDTDDVVRVESDWQIIYYAGNPMEAELVAGLLRSQGVRAGVQKNGSVGAIGELPMDALETGVWIAPRDKAEALIHIKAYEQRGQRDWICQKCDEQQPASYEVCWNCGTEAPHT